MKKRRERPILKRIVLIFIIGLSAALQYGAVRYVNLAGVYPNVMLVATVIAGYALGGEAGGFAGLCLGLYQDAQSGGILGMNALFFLYSGVIAGFVPKKSRVGDLTAALIAVYALTVFYEGAVYLFAYTIPILQGGYEPGAGLIQAVVTIIVPAAFLNAAIGIPYYYVLRTGEPREGGESAGGAAGSGNLTRAPLVRRSAAYEDIYAKIVRKTPERGEKPLHRA